MAFYGPMVAVEMAGEEGLDWESVLWGGSPATYEFAPEDILSAGRAEGPLVGGCLSLLASLCGTPEALDADGAILFWEDVGEDVYRLDRMLTQLERAGTFDGLSGMVIGSVVPRPAEGPDTVRGLARPTVPRGPVPRGARLQAGH